MELGEGFDSDELMFTGADLSRMRRTSRESYTTNSSDLSDISYGEDQDQEEGKGNMQLALRDKELRDKEEIMVEKALERIRRAQQLGRSNVRLSQPEIEALERKRRRDAAQSSKKSSKSDLRTIDRRRTAGSLLAIKDKAPAKKKSKGQASKIDKDGPPSPRGAAPPGLLIQDRESAAFAPFGYHPEQSHSSRASSRNASSSSLHQTSSRSSHNRRNSLTPTETANYSPPLSRRQLPDDPNWAPRPRSSSANYGYPALPEQYAPSGHSYSAYSPPPMPVVPMQYNQPGPGGRRIISAPSEVGYLHPGSRRSMVDPSPLQRHRSADDAGTTEESESEDDSSGEGVQVDVPLGYTQGERIEVRGSGRERNRDVRRRR